MERETGLEPATPSLEGSCSSQLSYSRSRRLRPPRHQVLENDRPRAASLQRPEHRLDSGSSRLVASFVAPSRSGWWRGEDSNLRRHSQQIYSLPRLTASVPLLPARRPGNEKKRDRPSLPATASAIRRCESAEVRPKESRHVRRLCFRGFGCPEPRFRSDTSTPCPGGWVRVAADTRSWSWRGDSNP